MQQNQLASRRAGALVGGGAVTPRHPVPDRARVLDSAASRPRRSADGHRGAEGDGRGDGRAAGRGGVDLLRDRVVRVDGADVVVLAEHVFPPGLCVECAAGRPRLPARKLLQNCTGVAG